jgi:hypothetical protein
MSERHPLHLTDEQLALVRRAATLLRSRRCGRKEVGFSEGEKKMHPFLASVLRFFATSPFTSDANRGQHGSSKQGAEADGLETGRLPSRQP